MTIIRTTALAFMLSALVGCVVPFGKSTGPDDARTPYFSNDGADSSMPSATEPMQLRQDQGLD